MNDLITRYKDFLASKNTSLLTIKNYLADVKQFIKWLEVNFGGKASPDLLTSQVIELYSQSIKNHLLPKSVKRHISSLRNFFNFLLSQEIIGTNPLVQISEAQAQAEKDIDTWKIKEFKNYLYESKASYLTIKNYIIDIQSFTSWLDKAIFEYQEEVTNRFLVINARVIQEYKKRLIDISHFSPRSVNRKLSSIRKYLKFLQDKGLTGAILQPADIGNQQRQVINLSELKEKAQESQSFLKRIIHPIIHIQDKIADSIVQNIKIKRIEQKRVITSIRKEFYAPTAISIKDLPFYRKLLHHLKYTRPVWYKMYHSIPIASYMHFSLLIIYSVIIGSYLYNNIIKSEQMLGKSVLSAISSAPRLLSFNGRLTDAKGNTIKTISDVRFAIYNDPVATGSALLWEETHYNLLPDQDGKISVSLGLSRAIPQSVFYENSRIYLGTTIGTNPELSPRKRLPNVSFATNAQLLQGMAPITSSQDSVANTVLALDSSGNLTIGGLANPTFAATGGSLKLSGQPLILATNLDSNANIEISPDGKGTIDLQKPIINSTQNGNFLPGGIELDDKVGIFATESAVAAFVVDNSFGGDLFTASASGATRFVITSSGNVGIGTNQPEEILTISGNAQINGDLIFSGNDRTIETTGSNKLTIGGKTTGNVVIHSDTQITLSGPTTLENSLAINASDITSNQATFNLLNSTVNAVNFAGSAKTINIGASSGTTTINNSLNIKGNLGLGTTAGSFRLDLLDQRESTATAQIFNASTSSAADGLIIKLGNSLTNVADTNRFVSFETSGVGMVGSIQGNNSSGISFATSGIADFAEYLKKDEKDQIEYGSIVCLDKKGLVYICNQDSNNIVGVTSQHPTFLGGENLEAKSIAVALVGQVETRVTNINGDIEAGDFITTSNMPGVGAKATKTGRVIGKALEGYSKNEPGKIKILVYPTWHDPNAILTEDGSLQIIKSPSDSLLLIADQTPNNTWKTINNMVAFGKAIIANLEAGAITAKEIITDSINVTTSNITIQGKPLSEYITDVISLKLNPPAERAGVKSEKLIYPLAYVDQIQTNLISPLASDSAMLIKLTTDKLSISKSASSSATTTIDNQGNIYTQGDIAGQNASISGTITSQNIQADQATVSGTFSANKIIANEIEGLNEKVASSASQFLAKIMLDKPLLDFAPHTIEASISSNLVIFQQGLLALQPSTFGQLSAMDSISVSNQLYVSANSINVIGQNLELQPLRQGGISLLAGLVEIDTDGNLKTAGNLEVGKNLLVQGNLSTNLISPLPNQNLIVKLEKKQSFIVQDASNSAVLSINQSGDLAASGSALFKKLNLFSYEAQALSDNEVVATGAAGTVTLKAYRTEVTINNPLISQSSLVYITPLTDTLSQSLYLLRQVENQSFTVGIGKPMGKDIPFNFLIVN